MLKFVQSRQKRKERDQDDDESATDEDEFSDNDSNSGSEHGSSDSEDEGNSDSNLSGSEQGGVGLGADEILAQPLVPNIDDEELTLCLICPGKVLKNPAMVDIHASSASHLRRVKRFERCAKELEAETGEHPTLHAVLYRMDTTTADLAPKERKKPTPKSKGSVPGLPKTEPSPNDSSILQTTSLTKKAKPQLSRKEKKRARKERLERAGATDAAASNPQPVGAGKLDRVGPLVKEKSKPPKSREGAVSNEPSNSSMEKKKRPQKALGSQVERPRASDDLPPKKKKKTKAVEAI